MKTKFDFYYQNVLKPNKIYFLFWGIYFFCLFLIFLLSHRDFLIEWFNNNRHPALNYLFIGATKLAETEGILLLLVFLLLIKYSALILTIINGLLATIVANIIKTTTDLPRPLTIYENIHNFSINFVPNVEVHRYMSFPSGHTTAAFAMLFALLLVSRNNYHRTAIVLLSMLVALSRVYLFQHFTRDVLLGSVLGVVIAIMVSFILIHFQWYLELDNKKGLLQTLINKRNKI